MHTIEISTTIIVAGTAEKQYFFQLIVYPSLAAIEVPITGIIVAAKEILSTSNLMPQIM